MIERAQFWYGRVVPTVHGRSNRGINRTVVTGGDPLVVHPSPMAKFPRCPSRSRSRRKQCAGVMTPDTEIDHGLWKGVDMGWDVNSFNQSLFR